MELKIGQDVRVGPYSGNIVGIDAIDGGLDITVYVDESELS